MTKRTRIAIQDLTPGRIQELSEDDVRSVSGGSIPDVGWEVSIAFESGSVSQTAGKNDIRFFKSRQGHRIG